MGSVLYVLATILIQQSAELKKSKEMGRTLE